MMKKILFVFIFLALAGCQKENSEWNPIFEDTNFDYLYSEIEKALSVIDGMPLKAEEVNTESAQNKLSLVREKLLELKDYYVPLTSIRHKIYDAERFFKLKNINKSEDLLNESKSILKNVHLTTKNKVFDKVILELESMLDRVILSIDDKSELDTYDNMKMLGEHINLMLSRGELVLSGIELIK